MSKPATTNTPVEPKRDRHGFRGVPPPTTFDFDVLADSALLSETDVAAILRMSTNTVASWRQQPTHPLRWFVLSNGFIRYTAAALRAYLASGKPRKRKPPTAIKTTKIQAQAGAAPAPPRRRRARPRTNTDLAVDGAAR